MKKIVKVLVTALVVLSLLPGCATMSDQTRTKAEGTGVGAVVGGLIGYAVGGSLIGVGLGFVIWEYVRKAVNEKDLVYVPRINVGPDRSGKVAFSADWNFKF